MMNNFCSYVQMSSDVFYNIAYVFQEENKSHFYFVSVFTMHLHIQILLFELHDYLSISLSCCT